MSFLLSSPFSPGRCQPSPAEPSVLTAIDWSLWINGDNYEPGTPLASGITSAGGSGGVDLVAAADVPNTNGAPSHGKNKLNGHCPIRFNRSPSTILQGLSLEVDPSKDLSDVIDRAGFTMYMVVQDLVPNYVSGTVGGSILQGIAGQSPSNTSSMPGPIQGFTLSHPGYFTVMLDYLDTVTGGFVSTQLMIYRNDNGDGAPDYGAPAGQGDIGKMGVPGYGTEPFLLEIVFDVSEPFVNISSSAAALCSQLRGRVNEGPEQLAYGGSTGFPPSGARIAWAAADPTSGILPWSHADGLASMAAVGVGATYGRSDPTHPGFVNLNLWLLAAAKRVLTPTERTNVRAAFRAEYALPA